MANLGAVGNTFGGLALNRLLAARPVPFWISKDTISDAIYWAIDITGSISGTIERDGTPIADARVFLFYRTQAEFKLISQTKSAADGTYSFDASGWPYLGLDKSSNNYFVMATDPQNSYNAKIYDLITPV